MGACRREGSESGRERCLLLIKDEVDMAGTRLRTAGWLVVCLELKETFLLVWKREKAKQIKKEKDKRPPTLNPFPSLFSLPPLLYLKTRFVRQKPKTHSFINQTVRSNSFLESQKKGMAGEDIDLSSLTLQVGETQEMWKQEMERRQSQVDVLQVKLMEVKACVQGSEEDAKKDLEVLWQRVKTITTLLTYLKSKARVMAVPELAHTSCGIKILEGVGLVDRNGTPLSSWSKNVDLSSFSPDEETCIRLRKLRGSHDEQDEAYIGELLESVQMVSDVMEGLVKRVIMAESETELEKDKVTLSQEEIRRKAIQIENMSSKLEEMELFALGTNGILNEMRQRVEDLVEETSRQRQRAAENEQELCRVKRDFESLKSYVSSLISVRETLLSSERQFQTIERLFERLVAKTTQLEGEKVQKETEVQKLMEENVRLSALLDKKEAQLLAMNEQCKVMALNASNI
ncbi:unnamed protein product [Dovyalis caffra]|uniref:Uncharacterized protein n=1 Tax=Dovyalis caffra TaxID=77055 RepID=A0AAV1RG68_9ROSI|nr:unnamed protein product [Dovyalis caffra]